MSNVSQINQDEFFFMLSMRSTSTSLVGKEHTVEATVELPINSERFSILEVLNRIGRPAGHNPLLFRLITVPAVTQAVRVILGAAESSDEPPVTARTGPGRKKMTPA